MSEYTFAILTIPVAHKDVANRVASLFDPDTGGYKTFGLVEVSVNGVPPATHYQASGAIKTVYLPLISDPVQAFAALNQLAINYDREAPTESDVVTFCTNVIVGETGMLRVDTDSP